MATRAPRERFGAPDPDRVQPFSGALLHYIEPVDGWHLRVWEEWDGDGFCTPAYNACHEDGREVWLDVSRWRFTPSQDRFAWLVRNGFPPRPALGPWDDFDIEQRLGTERANSRSVA